ncbi:MAG: glycosyltransferase [Candidatus Omnitrophica bacterium]|nr:glycosyltransferase [Candidatus Omnitrophota bacterium]MCB9748226.1 glycosyltransferase [Candidatus Omnitrophota bacterium]
MSTPIKTTKKLEIAVIVPWERKCGIATYSDYLMESLAKGDCYTATYPLPTAHFKIAYVNLAQRINRHFYDIVHIQHAPALFGGDRKGVFTLARFLEELSAKCVVTLHEVGRGKRLYKKVRNLGDIFINFKDFNFNSWYGPYLNYLFVKSLNKVKAVVVHSDSQKNILIKAGVHDDKVRVIAHGIPKVPEHNYNQAQLKQQYSLQGKFLLSTFGFVKRFKDYPTVIRALNDLPKNVVYIIAGGAQTQDDGLYLNEIRLLVKKMGLESRVLFTGFLSGEMLQQYHVMADLMVFPYKTSTASGAMAHAFAYGKAILASELPITQEINSAEPDTIKIYSDQEKLCSNILEICSSAKIQAKLEDSSLSYAKKYSFSEMARKTEDLYKEVFNHD